MCWNCSHKYLNYSLVRATCRVCELVDEDKSDKPVVFCDLCNTYICEPCMGSPLRRSKAFVKNIIE